MVEVDSVLPEPISSIFISHKIFYDTCHIKPLLFCTVLFLRKKGKVKVDVSRGVRTDSGNQQ